MDGNEPLRRRMMSEFRKSDLAGWLGVFCVAIPTICLLVLLICGTICAARWLLN